MFDLATGKKVLDVIVHQAAVTTLIFTSGGTRILSGSEDRTVRILDAGSGDVLLQLPPIGDTVRSLGFDEVGQRVIAAAAQGPVEIFPATAEDLVRLRRIHSGR